MIEYDETVDRDHFRTIADRHVRETLAVLDGDWPPASRRGEFSWSLRELVFARIQADGSCRVSSSPTIRASAFVAAPRARVFPLLAHPSRAPEWDASDRGFSWIEQFDDDHGVFRNFNRPLLRTRDSVIYRVERAALTEDRSLYCARSVVHPGCTPTAMPRILQQLFAWEVRDEVGDAGRGCRLTVLSSTPENMLPPWLFRLALVPGWRSIFGKIARLCAGGAPSLSLEDSPQGS